MYTHTHLRSCTYTVNATCKAIIITYIDARMYVLLDYCVSYFLVNTYVSVTSINTGTVT